MATIQRNPPWAKDELILALDLYERIGARIDTYHPEVVELSEILRELPLHPEVPRIGKYRSASAVHLKLQNFLAIDPAYPGKGLAHGGGSERRVREEFAGDPTTLSNLARAIREEGLATKDVPHYPEEEEQAFPEGRILYRMHRSRERNTALVRKAKATWVGVTDGTACRVCGFDFEVVYGDLGQGYIECHHNVPVSDLKRESRTLLRDLTPVCANCHRMLHRRRPWVSVEELSEILRRSKRRGSAHPRSGRVG